MFRCLKPGCPYECGTDARPGCADRLALQGVLLLLVVVLVASLWIGLRSLSEGVL